MYVQISRATDYAFRIHMCIARSKRERERESNPRKTISRKTEGERGGRNKK